MKYLFVIVFTLFLALPSFSQSYLGVTTTQVNLRDGAGTDYNIIRSLPSGSNLFIITAITENDFYNVIDIENNVYGYVHKSYVELGEYLPKNKEGIFTPTGSTESYNPDIEIYNNTTETLTLLMNDQKYIFKPKETKNVTLLPGNYEYIASAPGVIPDFGSEILEKNVLYSWEFYIVTVNR